ncbi:hypothetical protein GQ457_08G035500 [Hibiscus cannabinus]
MASLSAYFLLVVLFITSGVVIATEENNQIIIKNNCEAKMGMPCVWEVFNSIFKTGSVTSKCCGELVVLGKVCHSALVQRTLESPHFQNMDKDTIIQKTIDTWNNCLVITHSPSFAYSLLVVLFITSGVVIATEENNQIIIKNNCEAKMGMPCVWEVFNSIFKTGSVTSKCCGELVVLGKVCHSALVQRTLESPHFQNLDRDTIIQKSIDTWNNCLVITHSPSPSA